MSDEELRTAVSGVLTDCILYSESELAPDRAKATDYYHGRPFGNEEEGRSQIVLTEVRDSVLGVIPSFMDVFFGSERQVEFQATSAQGVEQAEQATDYVQYVFAEDNQGFLKTHAVVKDALVRKLGIFKWGWDATAATKSYSLNAVTKTELEALAADESVSLGRVKEVSEGSAAVPPSQENQQGTPPVEATYDVECSVKTDNGRVKIWAVPPEEFVHSRDARTIDDAICVSHHMELSNSDLVAMGVKQEFIDEHGGPDASIGTGIDELARRPGASSITDDQAAGEANKKSAYDENYIKIDFDGDNIAELRKICTLGPGHWPIPGMNTPVDGRPFSAFCPDPEPHTLIGQSWADRTMDIQRLSSMVMRSTLDSLALSVFPRMSYVEGKANVIDILNTEIGAPIRMREVGAVTPITIPWVGQDAIPMLQTIQDIVERRTGQNKGTVGLDADALQSTGEEAVQAAVTSSQAQQELLCRLFAEQALKPLFKGILGLLVTHQDKARVLKLRGKWVEVNPAAWDANMAVTCNTGLGKSYTAKKIANLMAIAGKQQEILTTLGPANPICSLAQYRNTLARICELEGQKDASQFFNVVDPNWQPPQQAPQPSPEEIEAQTAIQVEKMKSDLQLQIKEAELGIEQTKIALDHERRMAQHAADHQLARYELELKYHANISGAQLNADIAREESATTNTMKAHDQAHDQALEVHDQLHDHAMQEDKQQHDQSIAQQQADTAAAQPQGAGA